MNNNSRQRRDEDERESNEQCMICLEQCQDRGVARECRRHVYCYECIVQWSRTNNTCPSCSRTITCLVRTPIVDIDSGVLDAIDWDNDPSVTAISMPERILRQRQVRYSSEGYHGSSVVERFNS